MKRLLRNENGAAMIIEAVVIYPIVLLCLFFLIFVGLFMMQSAILNSCAEKTALLAAREVAYPGYLNTTGEESYRTGAVELGKNASVNVSFSNAAEIRPYRYWSKDPLSSSAKEIIRSIICDPKNGLVKSQSILGVGKTEATITCDNYLVTQYVTVTITQEVFDIGVLEIFGIPNPTLTAKAKAAVGDSDELARNTELIIDALDWLAKKLGINVGELKQKVDAALDKIGIGK